jgi:hypothetical protein
VDWPGRCGIAAPATNEEMEMRTEMKHPEYLGVHMGNTAWRASAAPSGKGWAIVLLVAVFVAGVAVGSALG